MHLWTEYEGNTLDGYTLGRLHRSEGRNGFFLTTNPDGTAALLRLTESHFDDRELVDRWRRIAEVSQPNLQALKKYGQATLDGVAVAYCILEATDASLSDVVRERALSTDETKEVAEAVARALSALHAADLVHEHVDATNVFAVGEVVKLRSDCARECRGDFEADTPEAREALRQRDVRDLGLLLLRCLGVEWQGDTSVRLPGPFDRIIPGALEGKYKAQGIVDALEALKPAPLPQPAPAVAAPQIAPGTTPTPASRRTVRAGADALPAPISEPTVQKDPFDTGLGSLAPGRRHDTGTGPAMPATLGRFRPSGSRPVNWKIWSAAGAAAAVLGVILWNTGGSDAKSAPPPPATQAAAARPAQTTPPAPSQPTAPAQASPSSPSFFASGEKAGWRVIAYTYNYEQQAQAKADQLKRRYLSFNPQVFSPTGKAPYFVALGGPSDSTRAMAVRNRARQVGLPRDTYARNF